MKIELKDNKVFFENQGQKKKFIHFGLEKELMVDNFVDKKLNKDYLIQQNLKKILKIDN
jgi:hypothetical protein